MALSSRNQIAVIDPATRTISARLNVRAQEPRAIAVRNGLLFVAAFEGHNQTETGACPTENNNNPQCTLGLADLQTFATNPNIPGEQKNIVVDTGEPGPRSLRVPHRHGRRSRRRLRDWNASLRAHGVEHGPRLHHPDERAATA